MAKSDNLRKAKEAKNDEFYTRLEDIENEISCHPDYVRQFQGKTVLCNCDDPEWSNFFTFFKLHFKQLGLKKLICTHYEADGSPSYALTWEGEMLNDDMLNLITIPLKGNGDFRSDECIEFLKEADIVVTNPPFSLFLSYVDVLLTYHKNFVIIGNRNSLGNKRIFDLLQAGKMCVGYASSHHMLFEVPSKYAEQLKADPSRKEGHGQSYSIVNGKVMAEINACWYTNLTLDKMYEPIILTKNYRGNETRYPHYDNYDAIECASVRLIPKDYTGIIAVPITFMEKYCSAQFNILGKATSNGVPTLNGKAQYTRVLIQRITEDK